MLIKRLDKLYSTQDIESYINNIYMHTSIWTQNKDYVLSLLNKCDRKKFYKPNFHELYVFCKLLTTEDFSLTTMTEDGKFPVEPWLHKSNHQLQMTILLQKLYSILSEEEQEIKVSGKYLTP